MKTVSSIHASPPPPTPAVTTPSLRKDGSTPEIPKLQLSNKKRSTLFASPENTTAPASPSLSPPTLEHLLAQSPRVRQSRRRISEPTLSPRGLLRKVKTPRTVRLQRTLSDRVGVFDLDIEGSIRMDDVGTGSPASPCTFRSRLGRDQDYFEFDMLGDASVSTSELNEDLYDQADSFILKEMQTNDPREADEYIARLREFFLRAHNRRDTLTSKPSFMSTRGGGYAIDQVETMNSRRSQGTLFRRGRNPTVGSGPLTDRFSPNPSTNPFEGPNSNDKLLQVSSTEEDTMNTLWPGLSPEASEPSLHVNLYRWPGWLRHYGASTAAQCFVRTPLEMMLADPCLYMELSPVVDRSSLEEPEEEDKAFLSKFETMIKRGASSTRRSTFNPFATGTIRIHLARGMKEYANWKVCLTMSGSSCTIKLESPNLTIMIQQKEQVGEDAKTHFHVLLQSLVLWKSLQWDLSVIPFVYSASEYLRDAEDERNSFAMFVIKTLHENMKKVTKRWRPLSVSPSTPRQPNSTTTWIQDFYVHSVADPCHPLGPIFSILDWLWCRCNMDFPTPPAKSTQIKDSVAASLFKNELTRRTRFGTVTPIKQRMSSTRMIVQSMLLTGELPLLTRTAALAVSRPAITNESSKIHHCTPTPPLGSTEEDVDPNGIF